MSRKRIPACIAALLALTGISRGAGEQAVGEDTRCGSSAVSDAVVLGVRAQMLF